MTIHYFISAIAILTVALLFLYIRGYKNATVEQEELITFNPKTAWYRASIFFCFCFLVSWLTGTMEAIVNQPIFTSEQLNNTTWLIWAVGLLSFILFAYWGIWARYTIRFERKLNVIPQVIFGLLWGAAFGQLFLSFWHVAAMIGEITGTSWATWQVWLLAYAMISIWQALLMDMYWDIYISPEHDSPKSIKMKVPLTHIPNVTLCLIFFAIYDNYIIFIALQTLALVGCSLNMRMPAPWCKEPTLPARRETSKLFGFPRCGGYVSKDPTNDKYLKAANLAD